MNRWLVRIGAGIALAILILTIVNAQWLAPEPKGSVKLVAQHGIGPLPLTPGSTGCPGTAIETPYTDYLPNSVDSIVRSLKLGAGITLVNVSLSADGEIVLLGSNDLSCLTNGTGQVSEQTVEQLKTLDTGYRYTADSGESFPLRGKGIGQIATLAELVPALPRRARLMYSLPADNPAVATALLGQLAALDRDPVAVRDAFTGDVAATDIIRRRLPEAWVWNAQQARECSGDYKLWGWTGYVPASCRGGTMIIPVDGQLLYWGWPNRLIARIEAHGGQIIMTGSHGSGAPLPGIALPETLGEVPASFNGFLMTADIFSIAPALHTRLDNRTQAEIDATIRAMQARRSSE